MRDDALKDDEIIRRVLAGEPDLFGLLVERYSARLLGLAFNLCGDYDTASDLVQETFISSYKALDRLKNPATFPGWMTVILKNKFRNLGRKHRAPTLSLDQLKDAGYDPPAPDCNPSFSEEEIDRVMQYVDMLPDKLREVIVLRYVDDCSYKEIAALLGLPVTTIATRLTQARKALIKKAKKGGLRC